MLSWVLATLTAVLIVVGTLVSGSGPHSGDTAEVPRMAFDWVAITAVHGVLGTATLVVAVVLAATLARARAVVPLRRTVGFIVVVVVQAAIGLVQALTALPALLVAVHLVFAALVWVGALRVLLDVNPGLFPRVHTAQQPVAETQRTRPLAERAS